MGFAPVNEMGVAFLFGAMAERLGFYRDMDRHAVSRR
jgi:hypothetical protein